MRKETLDAETEYYICEDRIHDIRHLKDSLEYDMSEDVTQEGKTSAIGRAWDMLEKVEFMLMGRLNELDEDYCSRYETDYSMSTIFKEEALMAKEAGINFVALWEKVPGKERKSEAVAFIKKNDLASLNYQKTLDAIDAFYKDYYASLIESSPSD